MDEQVGDVNDRRDWTKLDRLETAMRNQDPWSDADQAWFVAELRDAWARLAESEAWIPVDPSRIG